MGDLGISAGKSGQAETDPTHNRIGARTRVQLLEKCAYVVLHRVLADAECLGNRSIRFAGG
jgi:hypothetical protein